MALQHREQVESFDDAIKEDGMSYVVHQNNSSEVTTSVEKMKKGIDETIKAMENAHDTTEQMKNATEQMKSRMSRKKYDMEKLQVKLEDIRKQTESDNQKVSELKIEINKINIAIEKIKEISQDIDQRYLEQSQNDLIDSLVRITSDAEKAQSNLNVTKKIEEITMRKLETTEKDFNRLKIHTLNKISETEKVTSNVSTATQNVIKSYDEIASISKELFRSATSTSTELKDTGNYELEEIRTQ
jgi:methyl-accepting chemotaxis protein